MEPRDPTKYDMPTGLARVSGTSKKGQLTIGATKNTVRLEHTPIDEVSTHRYQFSSLLHMNQRQAGAYTWMSQRGSIKMKVELIYTFHHVAGRDSAEITMIRQPKMIMISTQEHENQNDKS